MCVCVGVKFRSSTSHFLMENSFVWMSSFESNLDRNKSGSFAWISTQFLAQCAVSMPHFFYSSRKKIKFICISITLKCYFCFSGFHRINNWSFHLFTSVKMSPVYFFIQMWRMLFIAIGIMRIWYSLQISIRTNRLITKTLTVNSTKFCV